MNFISFSIVKETVILDFFLCEFDFEKGVTQLSEIEGLWVMGYGLWVIG